MGSRQERGIFVEGEVLGRRQARSQAGRLECFGAAWLRYCWRSGVMTTTLLDRLVEILTRWVALQQGENYTGPVTFNFHQGKLNRKAIYLRICAKT